MTHEGYKTTKTQKWAEITSANVLGTEPFIGGVKEIGDKASVRPRNVHKEITSIPLMIGLTAEDRHRNNLVNSHSV
jgi:hypothetical protein